MRTLLLLSHLIATLQQGTSLLWRFDTPILAITTLNSREQYKDFYRRKTIGSRLCSVLLRCCSPPRYWLCFICWGEIFNLNFLFLALWSFVSKKPRLCSNTNIFISFCWGSCCVRSEWANISVRQFSDQWEERREIMLAGCCRLLPLLHLLHPILPYVLVMRNLPPGQTRHHYRQYGTAALQHWHCSTETQSCSNEKYMVEPGQCV